MLFLAACGSSSESQHKLSGTFYGSKTDTTLDFNKKDDYATYQSSIATTTGTDLLTGTLDYQISGNKITFKWGNKYNKKYGFKPGEVLGTGKISKNNRTITITKDNSEKNKRHAEYYDFLDPSFGKDNQAAKKDSSESASSESTKSAWKNAANTYINQNIKINEKSKFTFSQVDYDALVTDSYYGASKGANGSNITEILAKYPNPNQARVGFSHDNQLILVYGDQGTNHYVQLQFVQQSDGSYTLVGKTGKGLK